MRDFRLLLTMAGALLLFSCEKPVNNDPPLLQPDVTYEAIAGAWELTEWRGEELTEATYLYIYFDSEAHRFEMWDNLGSMYVQHKSGSFTIKDDNGKFTLMGQYDNGVGDWANDYCVTLLHGGEDMTWQNGEEQMLFSRIETIPELN